ncbi:hypothetical protein D3C71_1237840 [compost metagenome]
MQTNRRLDRSHRQDNPLVLRPQREITRQLLRKTLRRSHMAVTHPHKLTHILYFVERNLKNPARSLI